MAKQKNSVQVVGSVEHVQLGRVFFSHKLMNYYVRRDERDESEKTVLRQMLARDGWKETMGIVLGFDKRSPIWAGKPIPGDVNPTYEKAVEEAYQLKLREWDIRQKEPKAFDDNELWKACYLKDGKVIRPDIVAICCIGRLYELYESLKMRKYGWNEEANKKDTEAGFGDVTPHAEKDVSVLVPVQVRLYSSEAERLNDQIDENNKKIGFKETGVADKLRVAAKLMKEYHWSGKQIRDKYPGTVGQRAELVIKIDLAWGPNIPDGWHHEGEEVGSRPTLNLVHRMTEVASSDDTKKVGEGYLNFRKLNDMVGLTKVKDRSTDHDLKRRNERIQADNDEGVKAKQELLTPITVDEVERFFRGIQEGGSTGRKEKVIDRRAWEEKKSTKPTHKLVQAVCEAQLGNDWGKIRVVEDHEEVFNRVMDLLNRGHAGHIITALDAIKYAIDNVKTVEYVLHSEEEEEEDNENEEDNGNEGEGLTPEEYEEKYGSNGEEKVEEKVS